MTDKRSSALLGLGVLILVASLVVYSEQAFEAALSGIKLFALVVLPSLLPFFILSEVLFASGMVHFLGVLLEPLMRPLFNVPGAGSFVFSMGVAAGYPMDAVLTARFRREGLCSRVEAERLLAFSNTADPLFIFGAVAVGMFHKPALGLALALAHYIGTLFVGLAFRYYGARSTRLERGSGGVGSLRGKALPNPGGGRHGNPGRSRGQGEGEGSRGLLTRAFDALEAARRKDGRHLGRVLNDAIAESAATLTKIMSFIVLFSVVVAVLLETGGLGVLEAPLRAMLGALGFESGLSRPLVLGLFEIDLGTSAASAAPAPLLQQVVLAGAIISWSGLSVFGQVATIINGTDIRLWPFAGARVLHSVITAALVPVALLLPGMDAGAVSGPVVGALPAGPPTGASLLAYRTLVMQWAASGTAIVLGVVWGGAVLRRRIKVFRV